MRRTLLLAAVVVAAALVAPAAAAAEVGIVTGNVFPVSIAPEVEVCVVETDPSVLSENCTTPSATGAYFLTQAPVGLDQIEFLPSHRSGYLPQYYKFVSRLEEAKLVPVIAEKPAEEIDGDLVPGGEISGTVTAAAGGTPLPGVGVCAVTPVGTPVSCGETDGGGEYTLTSLATASYEVRFEGQGVSAQYAEQFYEGGAAVRVEAGQARAGIDAELVKGAQVTGTVTAAAGGGRLADVPVCLFAAGHASAAQCAFTDVLGDYALQGIAAGSYQVGFSLSPPVIGGGALPAENDGYLTQYFDGVANRAEARVLSLSGEGVASGIDAALLTPMPPPVPPPPAPVAGNVVAPPVPITEPTKSKPLHCKKGFVKKKVKKVTKCAKKPAKTKKRPNPRKKGKHPKGKPAGHGKR
jgi:carboxypeptidase family protein